MTAILNPPTDIKLTIASEYVEQVLLHLIQMKASFSVQYVDKDETESISTTQPLAYASSKRNNFGVNELDAIIEKELRSNKIPNSVDIAEELGMKPTVFKAWFRKQYDKPFYQYYMEKKMAYASELLKKGIRATTISEQLGYSHPIKFNKMFQKHFGITPKKYQLSHDRARRA